MRDKPPSGEGRRPVRSSRAQTVDATADGTVIVVGGAAMDHTWRIGTLPAARRSTVAVEFTRAPGGKGVSQAVAAAHLDLDVTLIAAVATDDDGREIEDHLAREGVDISLLHRVDRRGARTPATGIFELPYGNSSAAVWRDDVELGIAAIEQHVDVLATCDVLLRTFELPQSVLRRVLDLVANAPAPPVVIVPTGQPYPNPHQVSPLLKQIDYLVAYLWELEGFAFSDEARYDPELLSDDLLSRGLRSLCLLSVPNGGSIYERGKPIAQLPRMPGRIQEASVTRDAFCAALAARLIEDRSGTEDSFLWAAAAMASFADDYHEAPTTRPSRATSTNGSTRCRGLRPADCHLATPPPSITPKLTLTAPIAPATIEEGQHRCSEGSRDTMAADQVLALMLIFGFSYAIVKNWRKVAVFVSALAMTAVCFGVYSIVEVVRSDLGPAGVHGSPPDTTAQSANPAD